MFSIFPGIQHPAVALAPFSASQIEIWALGIGNTFLQPARDHFITSNNVPVQHSTYLLLPVLQLAVYRWRTAWMTETVTAQLSSRFARRHSPALQLWFSWLCTVVSPHLRGWFCNSFFLFDIDWHFSVILAFLEDSMNAIVKNSKCLGVCSFFLFPSVNQENADFNPFKQQLQNSFH